MPIHTRRRRHRPAAWRRLAWAGVLLVTVGAPTALAQPSAAPAASAPAQSSLDAPLFYQLLIGEIELKSGEAGNAYSVMLDAAQRTRDESLFKRTVEIALQARAGDQALAAARAWRRALPQSVDSVRYEVQLLAALNRIQEIAEPLATLLARTPEGERPAMIASLPRLFQRAADKPQAATLLEGSLLPYTQTPPTHTAARVAIGLGWWLAGNSQRALQYAEQAQAGEPRAVAPVLLALDLMPTLAGAEALVQTYLAQPGAEVAVRLAYVRRLTTAQRYVDAITQLQTVTREKPELASPWLGLGALQLELRQPRDAEVSLQRFLAARAAAGDQPPSSPGDDGNTEGSRGPDESQTQAWLMLAQAADMRGNAKAASAWLDKIDSPQRALEVQTRRATLLARQGKVNEARSLLQRLSAGSPEEERAKLMAESQMLREVQRWSDAYGMLAAANERFPNDADLLFEKAMMAEKLHRYDEMEQLLRRVIEIKPDHQQAYNALGYSLADRGLRLPEAQSLVRKALELAPGDPFISDSLGWVEYRLGHYDEALRLLRQAYASRPDAEIAAHLGEVLWVRQERDEARRIWREARERDAGNEVLLEVLARLQVKL
jgi:tetratricopeptide (TPR) repeat protein